MSKGGAIMLQLLRSL